MAGKGAPRNNSYAAKSGAGKTISLYLGGEDMEMLRMILSDRGEASSDEACVALARKAAKSGVYQLLIAKKSEKQPGLQQALQQTVDQLFKLVRSPENNQK